jgi:putative hemolysin
VNTEFNPFKIQFGNRWVADLLEQLLGLKPLIKGYNERPKKDGSGIPGQTFLDHTLKILNAKFQCKSQELLDQIPKSGPVVFVANHPLGGLEGVAMTQMLLQYRPDLLVLTNEMLTRIPELSDLFIGVDVLSTNAARANAKGIRAVCKHLSCSGAVLIYPAGMVSAIDTASWEIRDRQWDNLVGRLVKKYQATCVPFYVEGRNSSLFYFLGLIHKRLRTLMLPRELSNKKGVNLSIIAGRPITPEEIRSLEDDQQVTDYLRLATDFLARSALASPETSRSSLTSAESIMRPTDSARLLADVEALEDCRLLSKNGFSVYCAPYHRLGAVMDEIAFAREVTFRAAGEGTGRSADRDHYDPHYLHLFLWDDTKHRLVGGYRIGRTDDIIRNHGVKALYSRAHYHFDKRYINRLGKALEMGRSFIVPDYQRHPRALDMLWRGIGAYVVKNPEYCTLFGCVSISQEHSELARAFLSDSMMEAFRAEQEFLADVRPVVPLKVKGKVWSAKALASLSNIAAINKLLGRCDPGTSIPILLRQYVNLNGRFVCFSVNTGFNNSLDGLILVDLRKTPVKYLQRYLGKTGSEQFLGKWKKHEAAA